MPDHNDDGAAVAERLFAAIEAGDIDAVHDLYAPGAVVWHNHDGAVQSREESCRVLRWLTQNLRELRYVDVRRSATATGFVQQHVVRATTADGQVVEVPACIVGTCRDGRIVRLDEYLDSAPVASLLRLLRR